MRKSSLGLGRTSIPVRVQAGNVVSADVAIQRGRTLERKTNLPVPRFKEKGAASSVERSGNQGAMSVGKQLGRSKSMSSQSEWFTPINVGQPSSSKSNRGRSPSSERTKSRLFVFGGSRSIRKDSRPITHKAFQIEETHKVQQYFSTCLEFSSKPEMSKFSQRSITLKLFVEMISHLLRFYFTDHVINMNNYIEEVPVLMKHLHYPGNVVRSWLVSANTMHAWPHVIASLSWLVDLVQIGNIEDINAIIYPELSPEQGDPIDCKTKFDFYLRSYRIWNDEGDVDQEDALYLQHISEKLGINYDYVAKLQEELKVLDAQLTKLEVPRTMTELAKLEDINKCLNEDVISMEVFIKDNISSIHDFKKMIETAELNLNNAEKQLIHKQNQIVGLQNTIDTQTITMEGKTTIDKECQEKRLSCKNTEEYLDELSKQIYSHDLKIAFLRETLNNKFVEYNKTMLVECINQPDLKDFLLVTSSISQMKSDSFEWIINGLRSKKTDIESEINCLNDEIAKSTQSCAQEEEKIMTLESKCQTYISQRQVQEEEINSLVAKHEKDESEISSKIHSMRNSDEMTGTTHLKAEELLQAKLKELEEQIKSMDDQEKLVKEQEENMYEIFRSYMQKKKAEICKHIHDP